MLQLLVTVAMMDVLLLLPCPLCTHLCVADQRIEMHIFSGDRHFDNCNHFIFN